MEPRSKRTKKEADDASIDQSKLFQESKPQVGQSGTS